jgi:hypothetical protein
MLNKTFDASGFCFIPSDYYLNKENSPSVHDLKKLFDTELGEDRAEQSVVKMHWVAIT